jgi:hypothetical protein
LTDESRSGILIEQTIGHISGLVMEGLSRTLSTSPTLLFNSPSSSFGGRNLPSAKQLKPFATEDVKILLLENVNKTGQDILRGQGYQVEFLKTSLPEDELIQKIRYGRGTPYDITKSDHAPSEMFM